MSNEQWKEDGICQECRRKNYCSTSCKANKDRRRNIINSAVADKFLKLGFPEDVVDKTMKYF